MNNNFFFIVGVIFSAVALLHVARLFYGWEAVIGGVSIPSWISGIAVVVAGFLAYSAFRLKRTG